MFNPFEDSSTDNSVFFDNAPAEEPENMFATPANTPAPQMSFPTQQSNKKQAYNIVDLYWLINSKLVNNQKLNDDELELAILGYNADFNNLRITLFKTSNSTFTESSILKYEAKQIVSVNIFSETAQQILFAISQKQNGRINNFERIFSSNMAGDWKPSPTIFDIDMVNKNITIRIMNNNKPASFTFSGWEMYALGNAFNFMTNGQAWRSSLQTITSKNTQ